MLITLSKTLVLQLSPQDLFVPLKIYKPLNFLTGPLKNEKV